MVKRTRISTLSNTCFHIIEYTFPHHRTHISATLFVGEYGYAGTINRSPTAANGLPFRCWRFAKMWRTPTKYTQNTPQNTNKHSVKYQRSPTKWGANIPPGVGADSSCPYPNIIKYVYSRHQIRVSVSPHTHIHIIEYVYSFYRIRAFALPNTHIHTTARAFPPPFLWVNTDMRAR